MPPTPAAAAPCPRCGRPAPPEAGRFCPYCGRYLAALIWVAEPPPGAAPAPPAPPRPPYSGPPRYRYLPRWGFPARAWQPPGPTGPPPADPVWRARSLAASAVPVLWATAAVSLLAAAAETWRYALLLASRDGALDAGTVAASDAFVNAAGTVAPILSLLAGGLLVLWSVRARQAAAEVAGVRPARSTPLVVLGWLVPGINLVVPGSVLAEVEHSALRLPASRRPRPSPLLLVWWAAWAAGGVLTVVVLLWSLRTGVQARADGVVLHAVLDLLAVATAVLTALLVTRLTRLLLPGRTRREILVSVADSASDAAPRRPFRWRPTATA
ncbi:DUF4328 domain-containing protein [Pseudonocardia humida]|uniref:DUF4328 domain-containing protein n=1 Tax=Pseudonocardia humida TaxID=2800819 RepID=A0ABT1A528_9PSEU|nr:DUF4328 domain-containing protein [Pseudonocardia humida]MCO1657944.1 DUF4328 domain-containing protein [Pseudonocardia humida]